MRTEPGRDWTEAEMFVCAELQRLGQEVGALTKEVSTLNSRIVAIEVKSGVWGMLSGAVVAWLGSYLKS